jgi:hypothetical protein
MVEGTGNDFIWLMGHFSFGSHKSFSSSARCDKKKLITDPGSRALFPMATYVAGGVARRPPGTLLKDENMWADCV